ncbi:hypothetical protein BaRGS_00031182 [Batillaria attramentaria]|uniref:Uncharacterized protein n=1 Tax=Batillaria attramentaria TaxID=370345 RepID=A0ABD0JRL1_9CAEN
MLSRPTLLQTSIVRLDSVCYVEPSMSHQSPVLSKASCRWLNAAAAATHSEECLRNSWNQYVSQETDTCRQVVAVQIISVVVHTRRNVCLPSLERNTGWFAKPHRWM